MGGPLTASSYDESTSAFGDGRQNGTEVGTGYSERIVVKKARRILFLRVQDIDRIEAAGNYVRLWLPGGCHLLRSTISGIEKKLDPAHFLRIHRSIIVNVHRIREIETTSSGDYYAVLEDGTRAKWSRGYRDRLHDFLGQQN